jgi:hypothetical protein
MQAVKLATNSLHSPKQSNQSECANDRTSVNEQGRWYETVIANLYGCFSLS